MTSQEESREDLANMIEDYPQVFTYAGEDIIGTRSQVSTRNALMDGGYESEYDVFIVVGLEKVTGANMNREKVWGDTFTTEPSVGDKVIMDGTTYRIGRTTYDELRVSLQIDLETDQI